MNAFKKSERKLPPSAGSSYEVCVTKTVPVEQSDGSVLQHVEFDVVSVSERAESLGLPVDADFKLDTMLKAGLNPKKVNVSGMLKDEHFDGDGFVESRFDRLRQLEPETVIEEPASSDTQVVENE